MSVRPIARLGEPVLRQVATPLAEHEFDSAWLDELIEDLMDTQRAVSGAGLAAPQIFVSRAVCVLEVTANERYPLFPDIPLRVLVNPVVAPLSNDETSATERVAIYEGCLSVPGLRGRVVRPGAIRLSARTPSGEKLERIVRGVEAAIVQHEVDHLLGTLFIDRVEPRTLMFVEEFRKYVPADQHVVLLT